jgi:hypothetical protein
VGPGNAPMLSPEIFCRSRMLMCVTGFTYADTYKQQVERAFLTATGKRY